MSPKTLAKVTLSYSLVIIYIIDTLDDKLAPNPPIVAPKL